MCFHEDYDMIDEEYDVNENQELITFLIFSCLDCGIRGYKKYILPNEITWDDEKEYTCASCGEVIDEDEIIGDGTNRGLCCVPDYYDNEE